MRGEGAPVRQWQPMPACAQPAKLQPLARLPRLYSPISGRAWQRGCFLGRTCTGLRWWRAGSDFQGRCRAEGPGCQSPRREAKGPGRCPAVPSAPPAWACLAPHSTLQARGSVALETCHGEPSAFVQCSSGSTFQNWAFAVHYNTSEESLEPLPYYVIIT